MLDRCKSVLCQHVNHGSRRGKIGDAFWEVVVGGAVGKKSSDARDDLAEVNAVAPFDEWVSWNTDIEQGNAST